MAYKLCLNCQGGTKNDFFCDSCLSLAKEKEAVKWPPAETIQAVPEPKPELRRAFEVPPKSYPLKYYPTKYGYEVIKSGLQGNVENKHSIYRGRNGK